MSFLYYVPGRYSGGGAPPPEIAHGFEQPPGFHETRKGPDDNVGSLLFAHAWRDTPQLVAHDPSTQQWRQVPGTSYWVGMRMDVVMKPEQIARRKQIRGHWVELADGQKWLIPIARKFVTELGRWMIGVPTLMDVDAEGNWTNDKIVPRCQSLWDAACRWWDYAIAGTAPEVVSVAEAGDICELALAANYRLSRVEIAMLGLLDDDARTGVLEALVDLPTYDAHQKKTGLIVDTGDIVSGEAA